MEKQKKPWVKPQISFIPADSPEYKQIQAALEAEAKQHRGD